MRFKVDSLGKIRPVQAGERQAALREVPLNALNLPVGVLEHRDPTAELTKNLHSLEDHWREWKCGVGGRKPAQLFSSRERGGHGSKRKSMMFSRRLRIHALLQPLADEGRTTAEAIEEIKNACGHPLLMTSLSEATRRAPRHPNMRPAAGRAAAPARRRLLPPLHLEGVVVAMGEGVMQLSCQDSACLAPTLDPPTVPRPSGGNAMLQGMLANVALECEVGVEFFDVPHALPNPNCVIWGQACKTTG